MYIFFFIIILICFFFCFFYYYFIIFFLLGYYKPLHVGVHNSLTIKIGLHMIIMWNINFLN